MLMMVGILLVTLSYILVSNVTEIRFVGIALIVSGYIMTFTITYPSQPENPKLSIWNMELNSTHRFGDYLVTRVPNGWIYRLNDHDIGVFIKHH